MPLAAWLLIPGVILAAALVQTPDRETERVATEISHEELHQALPRGPGRRISAGGYDYGGCVGFILTVLLIPEPCDSAEPALARAPSPTAPPIIAAPGDYDRSATQPIYRIQLATVREEADARRAWDLYRLELGDVLGGFAPVIERADIANETFYRVQAGAFDDRLQAEAICDELRERNTACIVVLR